MIFFPCGYPVIIPASVISEAAFAPIEFSNHYIC
jgi:hypothetical protein